MKRTCLYIGAALLLVLFVYATLIYCVFFRYNPYIAEEESHQAEWMAEIAKIEDECINKYAMQAKLEAKKERERARLEKTIKDEQGRRAFLDKKFRGVVSSSDREWIRKTDERLARAEQKLADFMAADDKKDRGLAELHQKLAALRTRQQALQDLYEKRDRLMIWPLPLIAPLFDTDRAAELKEKYGDCVTNLGSRSKKGSDEEETKGNYDCDATGRVKQLEEELAMLNQENEKLLRQIDGFNRAREFEQKRPASQLTRQNEERSKPSSPTGSSHELRSELNRQLDSNLAEIKDLVKRNPACYINPSTTTIINIAKKLATMNDRQYCTCNNITLVRDLFYCTGCKGTRTMSDSPCCKVSRKQSFHRWLMARRNVDETARINRRIDELRGENELLQKKIRAIAN